MSSIKEELKEIDYYNTLSKDEKKLRLFLKMNYYNDKVINVVTKHLKSCKDYKKGEDLFKFYKKKFPDKFKKYMLQINYYRNNSYCSQS